MRRLRRQAVVCFEPTHQFAAGMFDALVERPGVAGDEDMRVVFAARPADPLSLYEVDAEGNVERNLDAGADDLAVALDRVAIS